MASGDWLKNKIELFKDDFDFRLETFILDITEDICKRMKQKNINRSELADLLNVSPPAVTKILNGNSNFTLKTLLSLADALGQELKINFTEKKAVCQEMIGVTPEVETYPLTNVNSVMITGDVVLASFSISLVEIYKPHKVGEWSVAVAA